jgi:hypothetical protein
MKGAAVRRWQELLVALGYNVGSWGIDGIFGVSVDVATKKFQADAGLDVDGVVGPDTLAAADTTFRAGTSSRPTVDAVRPTLVDGVEVWDYRDVAKPPKNYSRLRAWSEISGVMLHRTACVIGETPTRYLPVNAHAHITMGGRLVLAHAWDKMIWHGHGPSPWTIGVEIDGNPEGKPGYWWKPGGGPQDVTDAQVQAAGVLFKLFQEAFEKNGQKILYLVAHRQSSSDRECDPGWATWQKIAVPWMNQLGAIPGPREGHPPTEGLALPVGYAGDTWGSGLQVPREWDPRSAVPFWK